MVLVIARAGYAHCCLRPAWAQAAADAASSRVFSLCLPSLWLHSHACPCILSGKQTSPRSMQLHVQLQARAEPIPSYSDLVHDSEGDINT